MNLNDLETNQRGVITEHQRNYLRQQERLWNFGLYISLCCAVVSTGLLLFQFEPVSAVTTVAIVSWIIGFYSAIRKRRYVFDLISERVCSVEGSLVLTSYTRPAFSSYTALIGGEWFDISFDTFNDLNRINRDYPNWIFYYTAHSKTVLSATPLIDKA